MHDNTEMDDMTICNAKYARDSQSTNWVDMWMAGASVQKNVLVLTGPDLYTILNKLH